MRLGSAAGATLCFAFAAPAALALDLGNGFSIVGDVELEYVAGDGDDFSLGYADLTLSWRSASGLGADLSLVSLNDLGDNEGDHALWGGIVVATAIGDVTIGSPRPLMADFSTAPELGTVGLYSTGEFGLIFGSYLDIIGTYSGFIDIYGVTLEGQSGGLTYGLGVHSLRAEGNSVDAFEVTARYRMDDAEIYGGFETIDLQPDGYRKAMVGGRYIQDLWSAGIEVSSIRGFGVIDESYTKVYADHQVFNGLTLGIQYLDLGDAGNNLIGLSGVYEFGPGGFAELGYVSNTDGDHQTTAAVGFRF